MSKAEDVVEKIAGDADTELFDIQKINYNPLGQPNSQNAIDRAKLENLTVLFPRSNQLFIDIDSDHSYQMFKRLLMIFRRLVDQAAELEERPSKSGLPKRHITIHMSFDVRDEEQRAMFQAMLGSDRVRELLAYVQAANGDPHPTLFLETGLKALPAAPEHLQLTVGEDMVNDMVRGDGKLSDILTNDEIPF
jgi:hypothetical protein